MTTKGEKGGNCNRTACQRPGAVWYNHSTRKYYCPKCASLLNRFNDVDAQSMFGHDLCVLVAPDEMPKLKPLPKLGDLMSVEEWIGCVNADSITGYDGFGEWATKDGTSGVMVYPSWLGPDEVFVPKWATHVLWFNK